MEYIWAIWLVLFVASLILEAISMQLFSMWFAVGALAALIASGLHVPWWLQIILFVCVTAVSLAATRPLVKRLQRRVQPTNADRYVGKTAVVIQEIDNVNAKGQVKVEGQVWTARSADGQVIPEGATVRTAAIQGVKMIVTEPAKQP